MSLSGLPKAQHILRPHWVLGHLFEVSSLQQGPGPSRLSPVQTTVSLPWCVLCPSTSV